MVLRVLRSAWNPASNAAVIFCRFSSHIPLDKNGEKVSFSLKTLKNLLNTNNADKLNEYCARFRYLREVSPIRAR
jgi:hypothetical protein